MKGSQSSPTRIQKSCSFLFIGLIQFVNVSYLTWTTDATRTQPDYNVEFERSIARYRQYVHRRNSRRDLLEGPDEVRYADALVLEKTKEMTRGPEEVRDGDALVLAKEKKEPFESHSEPYLLGVPIKDWDEQRAQWLEKNPRMKSKEQGNPRVLIVTGSQPGVCKSAVGDHFHLKAMKNKMDYARLHGFEIYYNFAFLDPLLGGVWAKLPIARTLMLTHPEVEWLMWVDSDAIFTDMLFEIPFETFEGYNMVMWSWVDGFKKKNWVAVNDGVFFLRNCQWSLDLFDKWSPMGPTGTVRNEAGKMLSSFLTNRGDFFFPADDQSALVYVMLTDEEVLSKIKLVEHDFKLHGYWVDIVDHFEEYMEKYHPGLGDCRWPFTTHFTGCSPCNGENDPAYSYEMCMENFNRAFNFADNQVLAFLGYQHQSLESPEVIPIRNETAQPLQSLGINPWEDRIAQVAAEPRHVCT